MKEFTIKKQNYIRQNPNDNWNNVFKRYLLEMELIKSDSELSREMNHAQQIRMKREQQIQNFIHFFRLFLHCPENI